MYQKDNVVIQKVGAGIWSEKTHEQKSSEFLSLLSGLAISASMQTGYSNIYGAK